MTFAKTFREQYERVSAAADNDLREAERPEVKQAVLVIYKSSNGRDGWTPILPADVPAWVKEPRIIGAMMVGEMVMDPKSSSGPTWFKGVEVVEVAVH